jgi:hypothetical protein
LLTRFLFTKGSDFNASRVKAAAFIDFRDPRVSVFDSTDTNDAEIWHWGDEHVAPLRNKPVLARADLPHAAVEAAGLNLVLDEPPPRHYNICGFSDDKSAIMLLAQKLADASTLIPKPVEPA